jgi:glutamate--cysteine ligase
MTTILEKTGKTEGAKKMEGTERVENLQQLIKYFDDFTTPRENWRTGLECEVFAVDADTLKSVPYWGDRGIVGIFKDLIDKCNWKPVYENEYLIGLSRGTSNITLEPGGQIELSGSPKRKSKDCVMECYNFYKDLQTVCHPKNIRLLPIGFQPVCTIDEPQWLPKSRYQIMSKYFLDKGHLAHYMMKLTTSVQINIDYEDERDFSEKFRLSSYLAPILQSIYAYSPIKENKRSGYIDYRGYIWEHTDNDRCGIVKESFKKDFCFEDYVNVILDMPMILLIKDGMSVPMYGETMRSYMAKNPLYIDDFTTHLSFAFFETRLKQKYIEIRIIDGQHPQYLSSIPSLFRGLFYHNDTRRSLLDYFSKWTADEIIDLHYRSHKTGLKTSFNNGKLLDLAKEVFQAGKHGIKELIKEGIFAEESDLKNIEPIEELLLEDGKCPADILLEDWEEVNKDIYKLKDIITI